MRLLAVWYLMAAMLRLVMSGEVEVEVIEVRSV